MTTSNTAGADPSSGQQSQGESSIDQHVLAHQPSPSAKGGSQSESVRLQKALAVRGYGSRRVIEDMITQRRITVNGEVAALGRRVNPSVDVIEIDGVLAAAAPEAVYYLLNKPKAVITTAADTHGRETVLDLVPLEPRVWPVGRLDQDTEGLLLLMNDGELTHRLTHPSFGVEKEYLVQLDRTPSRGDLREWRNGVELEDGRSAPAKASSPGPCMLALTIHEGRNRQVRRMCAALGYNVKRLVRVRIGPLADRNLRPGNWRTLSDEEVRALASATAGN